MQKVCKNKQSQAQQAQVAEQHEEEHEEKLFMVAHVDSALAVHQSSDLWLLDSGCTNHMSPSLDIFRNLDKSYVSKVKVGNGNLLAVKGKGTAIIQTSSGLKLLDDVLFVPDIAHNLISVGQLVDVGYRFLFHDGSCDVSDSNGVFLMTISMQNRSFPLNLNETSHSAYPSIADQSSLIHKRLGHSTIPH